jgi:hypothetical protein
MELKGGRQTSLSFSIAKKIRSIEPTRGLTQRSAALASWLSADELDQHRTFVGQSCGRALWSTYAPRANEGGENR